MAACPVLDDQVPEALGDTTGVAKAHRQSHATGASWVWGHLGQHSFSRCSSLERLGRAAVGLPQVQVSVSFCYLLFPERLLS